MHFKDYGIIKYENGRKILTAAPDNRHITSKRGINKCKKRLAAFMLQGQEACFIHHLTLLCSKNKIKVYKNEHDGLITGNEIPMILRKEAAKKSGLKNPELKRKPLCNKEKRKETKKYVSE